MPVDGIFNYFCVLFIYFFSQMIFQVCLPIKLSKLSSSATIDIARREGDLRDVAIEGGGGGR